MRKPKRNTPEGTAAKFVETTGVDALAISFGTVHGVYKTTPKLSFKVIGIHYPFSNCLICSEYSALTQKLVYQSCFSVVNVCYNSYISQIISLTHKNFPLFL